ncbi:Sel1 repeat [Hartmannibacter diazotrophicus]|uniref:Sel1 repeat n=1 Tax=Hartmannibacter diazotrophicus TaxID=1482074 RepID=A0A2C9D8D1_9HYPH|nr:sel1 repeat family protein [Hartmannibacter diazotrophicus]SON56388.1 Sel1 repeat [Hartmannibacter diazotrophicus]
MARLELNNPEFVMDGQAASADIFYEMGMMYMIGRSVDVDFVAAHKWFNLAAFRGNKDAAAYRKEISAEMSPSDVAEAQRQAREWLSLH